MNNNYMRKTLQTTKNVKFILVAEKKSRELKTHLSLGLGHCGTLHSRRQLDSLEWECFLSAQLKVMLMK